VGLANHRDWTPRRLSSYLNPRLSARRGRSWDALSRGSEVSCHPCSNCRFRHRAQWSRAARSGRRVQSRTLVFKDGHPYLVGLPSPVPIRLSTVSRRFHPVALAQAGARSAEAAEHRTRDAPSQSTKRSVPDALGLRLEPSRPPCGETERCPDSSAPSTDAPRVDSPVRGLRLARTHASAHRSLQSSRPTDTSGAPRAKPDCVISRPRLLPP